MDHLPNVMQKRDDLSDDCDSNDDGEGDGDGV